MFHQFRREARAPRSVPKPPSSLATEQGFPFWRALGAILRGWALAQQGQAQEGIEQITQGLRAYRATGAETTCDRIFWRSSPKHMGSWDSQRQD